MRHFVAHAPLTKLSLDYETKTRCALKANGRTVGYGAIRAETVIEEIVRRVNAHGELVAALKAMANRWEPSCTGTDRQMYDAALAVLAKVQS